MANLTQSPMAPERKLYFAYGSNLWLAQMSYRCPQSTYAGRGILAGWEWHINDRHYANIRTSSPNSVVEGLCYWLSKEDEESLDESEGVATGCYQKHQITIELVMASVELLHQPVAQVDAIVAAVPAGSVVPGVEGEAQQVEALVYVDSKRITDDKPWETYRERIANGVKDAKALGISHHYFEKNVEPHMAA